MGNEAVVARPRESPPAAAISSRQTRARRDVGASDRDRGRPTGVAVFTAATLGGGMSWGDLFEAAEEYETTPESIGEALRAVREEGS